MAIKLVKYTGELSLQCETPTCMNEGRYLFGEESESLARKTIFCEKCIKAIEKGVKQQSKSASRTSQSFYN